MATHLVYPANPEIQRIIPLWMKFYCYEFSANYQARARNVMNATEAGNANQSTFGSSMIGASLLGSVFVPAPPELSVFTDAQYNTSIADVNTTTAANPVATLGGFNPLAPIDEAVDRISELLSGGLIDLDLSDATFQGVNKRVYTFKLMMPAYTTEDATAASDICNFFQAYQLPNVQIALVESLTYPTKAKHPPMWMFGVGPGNNSFMDTDWLGDTQLSLLDGLTVNKTAFKNNFGISSSGGAIKPLAQSATLSFVEIEPAFRSTGRSTSRNSIPRIINRSTAFAGEDGGI
jgi:hypothetical protein